MKKNGMLYKGMFVFVALALLLSGCDALNLNGQVADSSLKASGTISADSVQLAPEVAGKVVEIAVKKGDTVKAGDMIFRLDDAMLQAQYAQAQAGVQAAQSGVAAAQIRVTNAQAQYDLALQSARQQDQANRNSDWKATQPSQITLPGWYFEKGEQIAALQSQLVDAQKKVDDELANLDKTLKDASNSDFVGAEKRLDGAQQLFNIAQKTLDDAKAAKDNTTLADAAQKSLDAAQSELDAAQKSYNQMLSSDAATKVREARARVAVARSILQNVQDAIDHLNSGDESLQVTLAKTGLEQVKSGLDQANAALAQAQAAEQLTQVQLNKAIVKSNTSGVVLSAPVNVGEFAAPGTTIVEVGGLDSVTLTVYIPESQYGKVQLGEKAKISVDSFSGKTFDGNVTLIANQAEFTPRNVQTADSRSTTVYKVEITISNPDHALKPGMPADAVLTGAKL